MNWKKRLSRLRIPQAWIPGILLITAVWHIADRIDTAEAIPRHIGRLWEFMESDWGPVAVIAVGLIWIAYLITQPEWVPSVMAKVLGQDKTPVAEKLDELSETTNNLAKKLQELETVIGPSSFSDFLNLDENGQSMNKVESLSRRLNRLDGEVLAVRQEVTQNTTNLSSLLTIIEQRLPEPPDTGLLGEIDIKAARHSLEYIDDVDRRMIFAFAITNFSDSQITITGRKAGYLIVGNARLFGLPWSLPIQYWNLPPKQTRELQVFVFPDERLLEQLREWGSFTVGFATAYIEFAVETQNGAKTPIGYRTPGSEVFDVDMPIR